MTTAYYLPKTIWKTGVDLDSLKEFNEGNFLVAENRNESGKILLGLSISVSSSE